MSEITKISWADSTLNFWEGCTKVSAGCAHCYAEARDKRFNGTTMTDGSAPHWGTGRPRRKSKSAVKDALAYNRKPWICDECGNAQAESYEESPCRKCFKGGLHRRRIFSLSLGDWLDPEVPIEWLAEMLDTIRQCDQVIWILCTKRPENWEGRTIDAGAVESMTHETRTWLARWISGQTPPENVILLASVENQEAADERIPHLLATPAAVRGLSLEPLLGPVELNLGTINHDAMVNGPQHAKQPFTSWLVIGGESGPKSRPCNVEWIRSLVRQGQSAGVAVHVKQLGSNSKAGQFDNHHEHPKGGDPSEWPEDLKVREWPI